MSMCNGVLPVCNGREGCLNLWKISRKDKDLNPLITLTTATCHCAFLDNLPLTALPCPQNLYWR